MAGSACELPAEPHVLVSADDDCIVCHSAEYESAREPVHLGSFPLTCASCHGEDAWKPAMDFVHEFPLRFAHAEARCSACHTQGFESGQTPTECVGCHRDDYDNANGPPHEGYPTTCADCHNEERFVPSIFMHGWPLQNRHAQTPCSGCHVGDPPLYEGTPTQCVDCHRADYEQALQPSHDGFSTDCAGCHDDSGWRGGSDDFVHLWPLRGQHASAPCSGCHVGQPPVYAGTPTDCVDCHGAQRDTAQLPHDAFSEDCTTCHSEDGFRPASFDHEWPLTGAHQQVTCSGCHGDPLVYQGTPTDCVGCHRVDYEQSPFPGHDAYPTDCVQCHSNDAWAPASGFQHEWPITGAHQQATCGDCHGDPAVYVGTPRDCIGCHQDDYDRSPYPGHNTFPTDCTQCHSNDAWTPASGGGHPDNLFPLSGAHSGYTCNECHNPALGPNGRGNADCVGCHEGQHTRARMDSKHNEVRNYPTGTAPPNFCLDCHADGRNRG